MGDTHTHTVVENIFFRNVRSLQQRASLIIIEVPGEILSRRINFAGYRRREGYRVITVNRRSIVRRSFSNSAESVDSTIDRPC